ncbi:cytochrome P450 [Paenibacillus tarimensis]
MSVELDRRLDPYPWYAQMFEMNTPVFSPELGAYLVFRADDVRKVMADYQTFSSTVFNGLSSDLPFENQLTGMDPPRHTQLRALATHAFTPKAVQELEPRIQAIVDRYLDRMLEQQPVDFVKEFAIPFPITVIAELLGIPEEDRGQFKYWSDIMVEISERLLTGKTETLPQHASAYNDMMNYFVRLLTERRKHPQQDLLSRLAAAEVDGQRLSDTEASNLCSLLLVAGNETTTNLLTNAVRTFAEFPEQWDLLIHNPSLVPQAVEEVMRYRSSVQMMFRVTTREAQIGDLRMKSGERVIVFLGAANRDPAKYSHPDVFDITRQPGAHLTFGHGIHFCLGAPLARMEMTLALKTIAQRVAQFNIPLGYELEPLPSFNLLGLKHLPVHLVLRQSSSVQ